MDTESSSRPLRETSTPFLIRTFVKIGSFHRLSLFEDGTLPTTDEIQLFSWKDATLREIVTTLRNTSPTTPEYRHPLARFSFRTVYADPGNRGRFAQKDLGIIYSRDILGDPGTIDTTAPRLLEDFDGERRELTEREKEERTLEEVKFVAGDYLLVAVLFPKSVNFEGKAVPPSNGWKAGGGTGRGDGGWGGPTLGGPSGRGGGHWRGGSDAPSGPGRGRGGRGGGREGRDRDRDRERDMDRDNDRPDRRPPPPRRGDNSPPRSAGRGRGRGRRSRSPRERRNSKYD